MYCTVDIHILMVYASHKQPKVAFYLHAQTTYFSTSFLNLGNKMKRNLKSASYSIVKNGFYTIN